jgi:hypothetical protein
VQNSLGRYARILVATATRPEYEIERFYRDAPLLCIGEGTNEDSADDSLPSKWLRAQADQSSPVMKLGASSAVR